MDVTPETPQSPEAQETRRWRVHELRFDAQRSIRYHARRRAWFETWHNITLIVAMFASSAAAAAAFRGLPLASMAFSAGVALLLAADVVIGFSRKAALHNSLQQRFAGIEQRIPVLRELSEAEFETLRARQIEVEQEEPPVKRLLDVLCHFENWRATDRAADLRPAANIPWLRRALAHLWSQASYASQVEQGQA